MSVSCDWKITSQVRTGDPFSRPRIPVYSYSQTAFLTCCKVVQEEEKTWSEPKVHESFNTFAHTKDKSSLKLRAGGDMNVWKYENAIDTLN